MSKNVLFVENKNSSKLVVYFSSAGAKSFEGYSLLSKYQSNKLFIRDDLKTWYNGIIPKVSTSADSMLEYLQPIIEKFSKNDIIFLGSSMGAYAAILFGIKLEIGKVIAFSPQIVLNPAMPFTPAKPVKYDDLSKLIMKNKQTDIDIWFGEGEPIDLYHIHHILNAKNVSFFPIKGAPHNVLYYLKQNLTLHDLFDFYFDNKKMLYPIHNPSFVKNNISHIKIIHDVIKKFYLEKNFNTTTLLKSIKHYPLPAKNYLQGMIYMKKNNFLDAITEFKQALHSQPLCYDCSYQMALSYLKIGKASLAEPALKHAIKHYPATSAQLYARLAESQRLQGKIDKGKDNALKSLSIDTQNLWAHYQLGLIANREKDFNEAIKHLSFILKHKPNWDEVKKLLSMQYEKKLDEIKLSYDDAKTIYTIS